MPKSRASRVDYSQAKGEKLMKPPTFRCLLFSALSIFLFALPALSQDVPPASPYTTPQIVTDNPSYLRGKDVGIFGFGFEPGEIVSFQVLHSDTDVVCDLAQQHEIWTKEADEHGNLSTTWSSSLMDISGNAFIVRATPAERAPVEYHFTVQFGFFSAGLIAGRTELSNLRPREANINSLMALPKVALVNADSGSAIGMRNYLISTSRFSQVDLIDAGSFTPSLAQLQQYDSVFVWSNFTFANSTLLGNVLKQYSDGGGGVVLAVYAIGVPSDPWNIDGGITLPGYNPLVMTSNRAFTFNRSLNFATAQTGHPVLEGVSNFTYGLNSNGTLPTVDPGADLIASDNFGFPLIAARETSLFRIVGINVWPGSVTSLGPNLTIANALVWTSRSNTEPVAAADSYTTDEDAQLNVPASGVLGNDADGDGDSLSAILVGGPAHGSVLLNGNGSFTHTPAANFYGTDSFTYKANDGQADSNVVTVTITVKSVNDAPMLSGVPGSATINELSLYAFGSSASDVDMPADTLTFSLGGTPPAGAAINPSTGAFSWTPTEAQGDGSNYSFQVCVSDGTAPVCAPISITVNEVNSAPQVANVPASASIDELAAYGFTATGSDADLPAQVLTFSLIGAPAGAVIDPSTGAFGWTPTEAQGPGSYNITVRISDGTSNADAAMCITVKEVNSAPALSAVANQTLDEGTALTGLAAAATDGDTPVNTLTYSIDPGYPAGMSIDPATGSVAWTPTEAQGPGDYSVTVRVTDDGTPGLSDTKTFSVHVNEVNVAPELALIGNSTIDEQVLFGFNAAATDADQPVNNLAYSLVGAPSGATITAGGTFSWTPDETQGPGSYTFAVKVTDDGSPALSDEETITITVLEVNRPPVLGAMANQSGYWGNVFAFAAMANDPDMPTNTLTFGLIGAPLGASINSSTGTFGWTPTAGQVGSHTFTVRVTDNGTPSLYAERTVTINVGRRPTALVYSGDLNEQYSDQTALSATLVDNGGGAMQGLPLVGKTIAFDLGSQGSSGSTNAAGFASAGLVVTQDPAPAYTVDSSFAGDPGYLPATDSDAFDIKQEDARVYYTGALFSSTVCATCSTATVTLSATIKDITAESGDPAYDAYAGDIRKARVTFVNRDTNAVIASNVPVGLISDGDTKVGTATFNWNVNIGSADSADYTVGIVVTDYYSRNAGTDDTLLTVSKPLGSNFITGGGYLVMQSSAGTIAGAAGLKSNFGFNVKYNNSGKNLQGRVNVIVRGTNGRVYQVKGNVMTSLSANNSNLLARTAVFNGKANVTDITDPLNPAPLGGNLTLQLNMTDRGEPGSTDTIGITVWDSAGGLWHASKWNGTRTIEQMLGGGNVVVR